jgi:hypothetical protein
MPWLIRALGGRRATTSCSAGDPEFFCR